MRQHPISPVTEPTQYRAIGVVRGRYVPGDANQLTRGVIQTSDGCELEAVVLGRLLTLMRRYLDLSQPHLWVVYPRCREEGKLHLQMVGVWEPSTLSGDAAAAAPQLADPLQPDPGEAPQPDPTPASGAASAAASEQSASAASAQPAAPGSDSLPEGDDYFSIRGELIFTRPETGDLVVKVRQQPRADGSRPTPFKLQLRGEIPLEHLRHFVSLDMRRVGQQLCLEAVDVVAPINQRGNRGGKSRRGGERGGRAAAGAAGAGAGAGTGAGAEASPRRSPPRGPAPGHARAIHRPSR